MTALTMNERRYITEELMGQWFYFENNEWEGWCNVFLGWGNNATRSEKGYMGSLTKKGVIEIGEDGEIWAAEEYADPAKLLELLGDGAAEYIAKTYNHTWNPSKQAWD